MRMILKSMTVGALVSLAAIAGSGEANAALCGSDGFNTLANFTSNGASNGVSCTVFDKTFSGFSYGQDGTNVPPQNVGVGIAPSSTPTNPGLYLTVPIQDHQQAGRMLSSPSPLR